MTDDDRERPGPPMALQVELPAGMEAGVPADFASVWHTDATFVIDFAVTKQPPYPVQNSETGDEAMLMDTVVVSRVRIPPEQVFEVAKVLTQQLEQWELRTGRKRPYEGPPLPDDEN